MKTEDRSLYPRGCVHPESGGNNKFTVFFERDRTIKFEQVEHQDLCGRSENPKPNPFLPSLTRN